MKASASHTETTPRRRVGWSCSIESPPRELPAPMSGWMMLLVSILAVSAGAILGLAVRAVTGASEPTVIRYSLPLDLFQDSPEVQCGDGKRVLNGYCVCSASCDSLQEAEI